METSAPKLKAPSRTVYCSDAVAWLHDNKVLQGCSLVTSLPDLSEFPKFSLPEWKEWFIKTASLVLTCTPAEGVTVFYQTDIKVDGVWIDKGYLCQRAAEKAGHQLLWHKIFCRVPPGIETRGRPTYSHVLCFSKETRTDETEKSADVIPDVGEKTWESGMGINACRLIGEYIRNHTATRTIVNPFCGQGSMLAVANTLGLAAVGIERSLKRVAVADRLRASANFKWLLKQSESL